jgi:lysophosphatidylcholine acyltransferase/lyso-PAF acetyltransferase
MYPSLREQSNPPEFAERVRFEMAKVLNVPETEHTHGDLMLSVKAQQLKMSAAAAMMVEMGRVEKVCLLNDQFPSCLLSGGASINSLSFINCTQSI